MFTILLALLVSTPALAEDSELELAIDLTDADADANTVVQLKGPGGSFEVTVYTEVDGSPAMNVRGDDGSDFNITAVHDVEGDPAAYSVTPDGDGNFNITAVHEVEGDPTEYLISNGGDFNITIVHEVEGEPNLRIKADGDTEVDVVTETDSELEPTEDPLWLTDVTYTE